MLKINSALVVIVLLLFAGCQSTPTSDVIVKHVQDGDSFIAVENGKEITIRLFGVDCPEKGMDFANNARQFTKSAIEGKSITYEAVNKDRYGRTIALVHTPNGDLLNILLLENGLAHHYTQYSDDKDFAFAEKKAKDANRGIWSMKNVVKPWDFRKQKRNRN
ncbi:MAG: micrococcal nuclease [Sphingobacteriales bacterium]|jgi:micrococcal nuclease